jgi:hypothetical protein
MLAASTQSQFTTQAFDVIFSPLGVSVTCTTGPGMPGGRVWMRYLPVSTDKECDTRCSA